MSIEELLIEKRRELAALGLREPISVEAKIAWYFKGVQWSVHGHTRFGEFIAVVDPWEKIVDQVRDAVGPKELDNQTQEVLLSL